MEVCVWTLTLNIHLDFLSPHAPGSALFLIRFESPEISVVPPNSFSWKHFYFKYRDEGSQIFWIRFGWQHVSSM